MIYVKYINPGYIAAAMLDWIKAKKGGNRAEATMARTAGLHPWRRVARSEEVASMAVYLEGP
jgi:NAD(P)-dependent dehydrogenase (short-subunit alcohol dehydrogenase family)